MTDIVAFLSAAAESRVTDVVVGAIVVILLTIFVENLRRPRLRLSIAPFEDIQKGPAIFRSLRIAVFHKPLPWGLRWMLRGPASCRATITFHHLDGQSYFGRNMPARWLSTREPVQLAGINPQGAPVHVLDLAQIAANSRLDIYAGETEVLDVAVRFDSDPACYGWNNETYLYPDWKNPNWRLPPGRYLVKASAAASGETWLGAFRLLNDVANWTDVRLEPATKCDKRQEGLRLPRWRRSTRP